MVTILSRLTVRGTRRENNSARTAHQLPIGIFNRPRSANSGARIAAQVPRNPRQSSLFKENAAGIGGQVYRTAINPDL